MNDGSSYTTHSSAWELAQRPGEHRDRYAGAIRYSVATVCGVIAGLLMTGSMATGVGYAVEGHNPQDWTPLFWGDHWVWRAVASGLSTYGGAFLAGMAARRRGSRIGLISSLPASLFWVLIAFTGWTAKPIFGMTLGEIPLGYSIIATVLALVTVPIGLAGGKTGAPYGHANAEHFDKRRRTLFGIMWYHYLWLPVLIHLMLMTGSWGTVLAFGWMVTAWKNSLSVFSIIPVLFLTGMMYTLQLLVTGASGAYQALAGFDDDSGQPVWKRTVKYGFGYTAATVALQSVISLLYAGLSSLLRRFLG